jgi:L-threonylcarbamoyladenylate synthase
MRILNWRDSPDAALAAVVECLQQDGLVALPTDTLYALAADVTNDLAVIRLFDAKKRSRDLALPILIATASDASRHAEVTPLSLKLAERYWPGPLTMVLKRKAAFNSLALAGGDSIGLRVPDHAVPLAVISLLGHAITGTSANRSGKKPSLTADDVVDQFGDDVDLVVDGGPVPVGIQSTLVDLTEERPRLLREGAIKREELEEVAGLPFDAPEE